MSDEPLYSEYLDDPEMGELIEDFVIGLTATVNQLRMAISQNDVELVKRIAHQMKGAGGGYGFPDLSQVGWELENAVNGEGSITSRVVARADEFISVCRRVQFAPATP